jgi:hypothetical protein
MRRERAQSPILQYGRSEPQKSRRNPLSHESTLMLSRRTLILSSLRARMLAYCSSLQEEETTLEMEPPL